MKVTRFTIRINNDLVQQLDKVATRGNMTRTALIQDILYRAVGRDRYDVGGTGTAERTAVASWGCYLPPGQDGECSACGVGLPSSKVAFAQLYTDGKIETCCWACANRSEEGRSQ